MTPNHPYTTDTSAEAEAIQLELLRRMSPEDRIAKMCILSASLWRMAFEAIRHIHPILDEAEFRLKFIESTYGKELATEVRTHLLAARDNVSESNDDDLVLALGPVVQTLRSSSSQFNVGGSAASSYHGAVLSTTDVDLVCELEIGKARALPS